jgi:hypothetical protein
MSVASSTTTSETLTLPASTGDALWDLEQLLDAEAGFLGSLNLPGIEAIAQSKQQLLSALKSAPRQTNDLPRVQRIRDKALKNQVLTVHARDAVAAIVGACAPGTSGNYAATGGVAPRPGARLNVKV